MNRSRPLGHASYPGVILSALTGLLLMACGSGQAQGPFTVGMVAEASIHAPAIDGFRAGMADLGYVEGRDIITIYNGVTGSDPGAIESEIRSLLAQKVDLLFVLGLAATQAKQAVEGTDLPVVFGALGGPVERGVVESIAHPGGNLTGIQVGREPPKALEWLVKIAPETRQVYVPYNPDDELSVTYLIGLDRVASQLNIELVPGETRTVEEAVAAIERVPADIDAVFRVPSPTLDPRNSELSQAAIKRGLPMAAGHPLDEAMLLTLTPSMFEIGKQAARLAHRIRQGIKPADLPVETAEISLTINLETAKAIGLDIPDSILRQADVIIRQVGD